MNRKAPTIQTFVWSGKNNHGVESTGELAAVSMGVAKAELSRQGIVVKQLKKKSATTSAAKPRGKKIKPMDIILFTRNLLTVLKAGLPIVQAFDIIENGQENPSMKTVVGAIKADIVSGKSITMALSKYPKYFENIYCGLISVGEKSGTLIKMLERIEIYLERTYHLKKKVKKAMFYPLIILTVALTVSIVLLVGVVPKFQEMFSSFGADLPAFTQLVVDLSRIMQSYWWLLILMVAGFAFAFIKLKRTSTKFVERLDQLTLKLPIMGPLVKKIIIARFARILMTTSSAGMPIVEAMQAAANVMGNSVYRKAVEHMRDEVATGVALNRALAKSQLFPNLVVQMIAVGEESGVLEDMLTKIALHYESEVDNTVDNLSTLMEPVIMAVLGLIIGGFVAAMYMPIFRLGSVV